MDKHVMDRFVENHFDSSHNTFESVRRIADIYEWGNNVLWPGFFGDMGPCNEVGAARAVLLTQSDVGLQARLFWTRQRLRACTRKCARACLDIL